jgi:hypothetical protein
MAAPTKPPQHFQYFFIMIALLGVFLFQDYMSGFGEKAQIFPYSQFQDMLHIGKLDNLVVSANRIDGSIKSPEKGKPAKFSTIRIDPALAQTLSADHVTVSGSPPAGWFSSALGWLAPLALFWGMWFVIGRRVASGTEGSLGFWCTPPPSVNRSTCARSCRFGSRRRRSRTVRAFSPTNPCHCKCKPISTATTAGTLFGAVGITLAPIRMEWAWDLA